MLLLQAPNITKHINCFELIICALAFVERWIAEEQIVTAPCWCLLAAVRFEDSSQLTFHLVQLTKDSEDSLVDEFIGMHLAKVETLLQVHGRDGLVSVRERSLLVSDY